MDLKLESYIQNKTLVFTVTSDGYKYFTWNLWKIIEKLGLPWKLCILCLDKESNDFFNRIAVIPSRLYLMNGPKIDHKTPATFGTTSFKRMNRMKINALHDLSQRLDIETLLFLDSDIAIFRDPLPYIHERLSEAPLWLQCDEKREDSFVCCDVDHCTNPCTGVIAMRMTDESRKTFKQLYSIESETWREAVTDQDYIFHRLKQLQIPHTTLDRGLFPNGTFLARDRFKQTEPYLLHFNYMMGSQKKQFMKQKECWFIDV